MTNNIKGKINGYVIHETFDPEGRIATQIVKTDFGAKWLLQYDASGHVTFSQKMEHFSDKDITYYNGRIATIKQRNVITQYDDKCNITCQITVDKDDIINFNNGYLQSVTKNTGNMIQEIEFGERGRKLSSTQKVRKWVKDQMFWLTTEAKQYYPNGKIQSVVTYEQKTAWTSNFDIRTGGGFSSNFYDEEKAMSYISSITQYDENGKIVISAQLKEYDEVNFNQDKVASIIKRTPNGDIISQTIYYPNGQISSVIHYANNQVISSVSYDETGKPTTISGQNQKPGENNQQPNTGKQNAQKTLRFTKDTMHPAVASHILGVSLNASEQEINKAYRKLCKQWHPDRNPGNEELAKRKMQIINEAHDVMIKYARSRQNRPNQNQNPNTGSGARPTYESPAQKAWKKLQEAIREAEIARQKYEQATANKNRLLTEYSRMPFSNPRREKIFAELQKANAYLYNCIKTKAAAEMKVAKCKQDYYLACMVKTANMKHQKTYQYAA